MPVTTTQQEYERLRAYLNPYIKGPNTDAVLYALASGCSSYLINQVAAVNSQLYIATAGGTYLDARLAESGITRPPTVGLSDDVFRQIGIQVKNRKQVRDLINNLLDAIFGDEFVRASNPCRAFEPYNLNDGDTLIINFDESDTATVTFNTADFEDIATAQAQEVADAITKSLRNQGLTGTAIAKNNGNGGFVEILSDTIGAVSSVTILGGEAQNALLFDAPIGAGGNLSTQWTLTLQPGGFVRFTWTGGANPQIGRINVGNYVNIFGGGFASSTNEGSYTITKFQGGAVGVAYFEVSNAEGTPGVIVQGTDSAVLFYSAVKKTLNSQTSYAVAYQTQGKVLQIFLPAATQVIRRGREGSAHVHYPPTGSYTFTSNSNSGDQFAITSTVTLTAGVDFVIGANVTDTIANFAAAVNAISGIVATIDDNVVQIFNDSLSNTLVITYTGTSDTVASGPQGDPTSLQPNQPGPYVYDLSQSFTVGAVGTTLTSQLNGAQSRLVPVVNANGFPNSQGYLVIGYGTSHQEGPVPYISVPSSTTILISPAYTIQNDHPPGTTVTLISAKSPVVITGDGLDYPFYITDVVSGRLYAQDLINDVIATGINIVFTILYPNDIGLGKGGTQYSEIAEIWGP